jgi:putative ABC transport system ATP-binding protein
MAARIHGDPSSRGRMLKLVEEFGLGDRLNALPRQLSGGEKQRVALIQALGREPSIVLADEPTAALDAPNARFVASVLQDYAMSRQAVVVCVTHDRTVLEAADEIIRLDRPSAA